MQEQGPTYRLLLIGPDPIRSHELCTFIDRIASLKLLGIVREPVDAMPLLQERKIDLLILDVHSQEPHVLSILEELDEAPQVILSTDLDLHALEGFEHGIADLLLRPYTFDRFRLAISRAIAALQREQLSAMPDDAPAIPDRSVISIRSGRRSHYIKTNSILLIEAVGNNVRLELVDREVQANTTLKQMEELLPDSGFTRVHRSYIVADRIVKDMDNETLYTQAGEVPIGAAFRNNVKRSFSTLRTTS